MRQRPTSTLVAVLAFGLAPARVAGAQRVADHRPAGAAALAPRTASRPLTRPAVPGAQPDSARPIPAPRDSTPRRWRATLATRARRAARVGLVGAALGAGAGLAGSVALRGSAEDNWYVARYLGTLVGACGALVAALVPDA